MYIAHLDADCFYVSAERKRRRHLKGMAVGVLGNQGACVIAKSYEMKAAGVTTGMPVWEARPVCPEGVYIKRDFKWYKVVSEEMLSVVQEFSPCVEFYSIDEFFFVVKDASLDIAKRVQQAIFDRVKIPVSIGIAPTKTLAKLISDSAKPNGCGVITNDDERLKVLQDKHVTEITGIAKRRARTLAEHGVTTCEQFAKADRRLIRHLLTKTGEDLWWELNGESVLSVKNKRADHKFVSRGGSIGAASNDPDRVKAFVVRNSERLVEALAHYDVRCDNLTLEIEFKDGSSGSKRCSLPYSTREYEPITEAALGQLSYVWRSPEKLVHYIHLIAGDLRYDFQPSLFDQVDHQITQLKLEVNEKIGRFAVRSGTTLPLKDIHEDPANDFDICDIHGKSCF